MKTLIIISCIGLLLTTGCANKEELARLQSVIDANAARQTELSAQEASLKAKIKLLKETKAAAIQAREKVQRQHEQELANKKDMLRQLEQQKSELGESVLGNDLITLANDAKIEGVIEKFDGQVWHIRMESGEIKKGSLKSIKSIQFASP